MGPYRKTYAAILARIRNRLRSTPLARSMARKAGLRAPEGEESPGGSEGGSLILSVPPVVAVGGCPREPIDPILPDDPDELDAWYEDVQAAEEGDAAALEDMRDWLISFGLEDTIVMTGVMPRLRYDWNPEDVYTFTVDPDSGCPVEVDITPPEDGLWEQYKGGDSRFPAHNITLSSTQDYRALVKSLVFRNAAVAEVVPSAYANMNETAIAPYPECDVPGADPSDPAASKKTHDEDAIMAEFDTPRDMEAVCYRQSFGSSPFQVPVVNLTNDALLDNLRSPTYSNTGSGTGPRFGIHANTISGAPGPTAGKVTVGESFNTPIMVETHWRQCGDAPEPLTFTHDCFVTISSTTGAGGLIGDDVTHRESTVTKEATINTQTVDWSIDPSGAETMVERYNAEFPTFDVVAVRMKGRGPSVPV